MVTPGIIRTQIEKILKISPDKVARFRRFWTRHQTPLLGVLPSLSRRMDSVVGKKCVRAAYNGQMGLFCVRLLMVTYRASIGTEFGLSLSVSSGPDGFAYPNVDTSTCSSRRFDMRRKAVASTSQMLPAMSNTQQCKLAETRVIPGPTDHARVGM